MHPTRERCNDGSVETMGDPAAGECRAGGVVQPWSKAPIERSPFNSRPIMARVMLFRREIKLPRSPAAPRSLRSRKVRTTSVSNALPMDIKREICEWSPRRQVGGSLVAYSAICASPNGAFEVVQAMEGIGDSLADDHDAVIAHDQHFLGRIGEQPGTARQLSK